MKSPHFLTKIYIITAVVFGWLQTQSSSAQTLITNEYWISPSTNTANLGTLDAPFDGSTQAKFDTAMGNMPPNSTIHILAGTYQTYGDYGWFIKSGQKLLGSGMGVTIVQLIPQIANSYTLADDGEAGDSGGTNEEVADLTVDCNYQGGSYDCSGVGLNGPGMIVRGVKVIHNAYYSADANSEAWGIACVGQGELIEGCEVTEFDGGINNAISSITISGGSGIIRDNQVIFTNNTGSCFGFNGSGNNGVLIEGNTINGACVGVYNDTADNTNITIVNNVFENGVFGLFYGVGYNIRQNYIFSNNTILLATNFPSSNVIAVSLGDGCTNWNIIGNMVGWYHPPQSGDMGVFLNCAPDEQGVLVANNRVDPSFTANYIVTNGYTAYGNYDFNGNWLTNLDQTPF
jgi:hypothetical protein